MKLLIYWKIINLFHSFSLFFWLSTHLPTYLLYIYCIYRSIDLSIDLSIVLSIYPIGLSLFHSITYLSNLFICLFIFIGIYLSICLFIYVV